MGDAVAMLATSLTTGELAYLVATVLDEMFWPSFTRAWLASNGPTFELCAGDYYPVNEMQLMGAMGYSARPDRRGLRPGELAHVRSRRADEIRVVVNGEYPLIIDGLAASTPLHAAVLLPNESSSQLTSPPGCIGPVDTAVQRSTITALLQQAAAEGDEAEEPVGVVVLPELSVDEDIVASLANEWAAASDRPILFAGSAHVDVDDGGRRVNRTTVLLPSVGAAWHHDKSTLFVDRDGNREPTDPAEPSITLGCGFQVRVATLICKDALNVDIYRLAADLGVQLLAVPAMSDRLGDFMPAAGELVAQAQGATLVANNPRQWNGENVEHALLGQPVRDAEQRIRERRSDGAPDLAVARLGSGWLP